MWHEKCEWCGKEWEAKVRMSEAQEWRQGELKEESTPERRITGLARNPFLDNKVLLVGIAI